MAIDVPMTLVRKFRWLLLYQAVLYGLGIVVAVGLIPLWGQWYSQSEHHRAQVQSLLHGALALSHEPSALAHDLAWSEGGVHQVWGLGIPLWRLPFGLLARCVGAKAFPDMVALTLALGLAAWALLGALFGTKASDCLVESLVGSRTKGMVSSTPAFSRSKGQSENAGTTRWRLMEVLWLAGAAGLLLLFPPFLNLLQSRFDIYEEVIAYEYLVGLGLIAGLTKLAQHPSPCRYWLMCALAGVGGLFRPTLFFHGGAAVLAGAVALCCGYKARRVRTRTNTEALPAREKDGVPLTLTLSPSGGERASAKGAMGALTSPEGSKTLRWLQRGHLGFSLAVGLGLFVLGGGSLFVTNLVRFGSGFEFGHRLNVQDLYGSLYSTRFDNPYQNEPLLSAGRELFGLLFLTKDFNGAGYYQEHFFAGQSPMVRWREVYLTAYDLSYLVWLVVSLAAGVVVWAKLWHWRAEKAELNNEERAGLVAIGALSLYGAVASALLMGFYLRCEVISSRYLLDLMPSFAALMLAGWLVWGLFWLKRAAGVWVLPASAVLLAGWLSWEIHHSGSAYGPPRVLTWEEVKTRKHLSAGWTNPPPAGVYESPAAPAATGIPYNGAGWDRETGMVMPCVILFVNDPAFLELEVATNLTASFTPEPEQFRAKVGLEFLKREFIKRTASGWLIRFRGPESVAIKRACSRCFWRPCPTRTWPMKPLRGGC